MPSLSVFPAAAHVHGREHKSLLQQNQPQRAEFRGFHDAEPPISGSQRGIISVQLQSTSVDQKHRNRRATSVIYLSKSFLPPDATSCSASFFSGITSAHAAPWLLGS